MSDVPADPATPPSRPGTARPDGDRSAETEGADVADSNGPDGAGSDVRRDDAGPALALGDHLEELRGVLIKSLIALVIGIAVCFALFGDNLFGVFVGPLVMDSMVLGHPPRIPGSLTEGGDSVPGQLVAYDVLDRFKVLLFVAIVGGIFFAGPYILWQVWCFVRIGLYPKERRIFYLLMPGSALLFACGVAFGYFIMLPVVVDFMLNLGGEQFDTTMRTELRLGNYLTYFVTMTLMIGVMFQIPVVMTVVARVTDVDPTRLRTARRYVVFGALVVGMLFTPPDPVTQVMLAVPILLLFELGLLFAGWAHRVRMREHAAIMEGPDPWQQMWDEQESGFDEGNDSADRSGGAGVRESGGGSNSEGAPAADDGAPDNAAPLEDTRTHKSVPPGEAVDDGTSSDDEEDDAFDVPPAAGPVPRSVGVVTWIAPEPADDDDDDGPAEDEGERPADDAGTPAAGETSDGSPFGRETRSANEAALPLTEGDVLALIDMRLAYYLREEVPELLRQQIAAEVRRQVSARGDRPEDDFGGDAPTR